MSFSKICFMGLGYIGLPTAAIAAGHGLKVTGVDINKKVVDTINKGEIHIIEPGLETQCGGIQTLKEFDTLEQLKQFITDNGLIDETNNPI